MANVASTNYTAENTQFSIPGNDADSFSRDLHVTALGQALEEHTHASTRGAAIVTNQLLTASAAFTVTGTITQTGTITATHTANNLTLTNTDAGASSQIAIFQGDSASAADNDEAYFSFKLSNDAGEQTEVGRFSWVATDVSNSTEDGRLDFAVMTNGTLADELSLAGQVSGYAIGTGAIYPAVAAGLTLGTPTYPFYAAYFPSGGFLNFNNGDVTLSHSAGALTLGGGGLVVGSPTGGLKGDGTINATAVYDDNSILSDYVFSMDYKLPSIKEMTNFFKKHLHLPTIPGRKEWEENGKFSLGKIATHLWETVEVQARYISELDNRVITLEKAIAQYR